RRLGVRFVAMTQSTPEGCAHCGAPRQAGLAQCAYCKTPFVQNSQSQAVPCPSCKTLNEWGAQKCAKCQAWVVVQCVFCNSLSPHHVPACLTCNEPFLGAPERLAERKRQASMERGFEVATAVAGVAAPFLGALAGSALAGGHHHHHHRDDGGW